MSAPENPPAFPCLDNNGEGLSMRFFGMTLRDHYAGLALSGLHGIPLDLPEAEHVARRCYMTADAMLAERAKGGVS